MSLCRNCLTAIRSFCSPFECDRFCAPRQTVRIPSMMASASETQVVGAKGGLDRWYYFSQSMECELCAMMKAQMSWKYGPRGLAICAISFNGSPRRLKGWINSWLAFSFSVNVGDIERVDHDTRVSPSFVSIFTSSMLTELVTDSSWPGSYPGLKCASENSR